MLTPTISEYICGCDRDLANGRVKRHPPDFEPPNKLQPHHQAWLTACWDRWELFKNANPGLRQSKIRTRCVRAYLPDLKHKCRSGNHFQLSTGLLDHAQDFNAGRGGLFTVGQPYIDKGLGGAVVELAGQGLVFVNGGRNRSWYFPGHSTLILIGAADVLSKINVGYSTEDAAPLPQGCR